MQLQLSNIYHLQLCSFWQKYLFQTSFCLLYLLHAIFQVHFLTESSKLSLEKDFLHCTINRKLRQSSLFTGGQNPSVWAHPTETLGEASWLGDALCVFKTMGWAWRRPQNICIFPTVILVLGTSGCLTNCGVEFRCVWNHTIIWLRK